MKEKRESKQRRILLALLKGMRLTPDDANRIGKTSDGTRLIRFIREDYPVLKAEVAGENYKVYYLDPEWLAQYNAEKRKPFCKRVGVCLRKGLRLIFENPITGSFLNQYFLKPPTVKDMNRMLRGDYYVKPTGYWFWNCEPTHGFTEQRDKAQKKISLAESRWTQEAGICSEERSMISPDYARNFICDFILGKEQIGTQLNLF